MKKININLSTNDIKKLIKNLESVQKGLKDCENEITKELVTKGVSLVEQNYANTQNRPFDEDYTVVPQINGNKGKIISQGSSVIYMEFGTGEIGANSPQHKKRDKFTLKDFNTGKYMKKHEDKDERPEKNGQYYWFYKKQYTQGIPAGSQVYKAAEDLKDLAPDIIRKVVDDKIWKPLSHN